MGYVQQQTSVFFHSLLCALNIELFYSTCLQRSKQRWA